MDGDELERRRAPIALGSTRQPGRRGAADDHVDVEPFIVHPERYPSDSTVTLVGSIRLHGLETVLLQVPT